LRKNPTSLNHLPGVGFLGNYINGKAAGYFWIGMAGDGLLHGNKNIINVVYSNFCRLVKVSGFESAVTPFLLDLLLVPENFPHRVL